MAANRENGISYEVVDQLLVGRDPATVFESGGLVDELKKRLAERMLNGEMDHHLGGEAEEETDAFASRRCERGDLNPHALRHRILSPARLPFRHSRAD
jgi:transposase-like protein